MEIIEVAIKDLIPAVYNPRKISPKEKGELRTSLETFGFVEPIVVNKNPTRKNIIIGGHQRLLVWREMGNSTVPCVFLDIDDISKEQELNLRLNKNTAGWDWQMLKQFEKSKLETIGFKPMELEKIFGGASDLKPEVEFTEELLEAQNYIVLYFDNEIDWLQLQTLFPLKTVKALDSKEGYEKAGVGRVVRGVDFINALKK